MIGLEGMDEEQLQLGSSDTFWTLITERRSQKSISRSELEERIAQLGADRHAGADDAPR